MDHCVVALGMLVVALAGFIQGLTSFGFALLSMPVLVKILPLRDVVPIVVLLSLCTNLVVLSNCLWSVHLGKIWVLVLSSLVAAPLGTYALLYIDQ